MFDWMLPENHAVAILKKDHQTIKGLFEEFEKAETPAAKEKIIEKAVTAVKIHAVLEEEIFYPTVRAHVGNKIMNEADGEDYVAKVLIAELERGASNDHREVKFTALAVSIRQRIREEESELLPEAKKLDIDFGALGRRILERKKELVTGRDTVGCGARHGCESERQGAFTGRSTT